MQTGGAILAVRREPERAVVELTRGPKKIPRRQIEIHLTAEAIAEGRVGGVRSAELQGPAAATHAKGVRPQQALPGRSLRQGSGAMHPAHLAIARVVPPQIVLQ